MPESEFQRVHVYDVKATVALKLDQLLRGELRELQITVKWPPTAEPETAIDLRITQRQT